VMFGRFQSATQLIEGECDQADELALLAKLKLWDTTACISKDPILGLLQDSGTL
jgi:hypothetical protein